MMGYDIRWDLIDTNVGTKIAKSAQDGFTEGRTRAAYSALGRNPDDQNALNALLSVAPEKVMQYRQYRRQEGDYQREADYRSAAGDYLTAGQGPQGSPIGMAAGTVNALLPQAPSPQDEAFRRMARADPDKAMTARSNQVKLSKEQLDLHQDLNGAALRLLATVHDQPSYDAAKQRAARMYGRFGINIEDLQLPPAYDPQAIRGLMLQTLETDKLLAAERAERRLEWDMEDDEADNARADRSTDSLIDARGASTAQGWERVGISRENMDRTDARGRRGQDISAETTRRGQDMTDKRVRGSYAYSRGNRRRGAASPAPAPSSAPRDEAVRRAAGGGASVPMGSPLAPPARPSNKPAAGRIIVNPKTGQRMQERNGQWVPVK